MTCYICGLGMGEGISLFRVNEKGVPGIWVCEDDSCNAMIDKEVLDIVHIIEGRE